MYHAAFQLLLAQGQTSDDLVPEGAVSWQHQFFHVPMSSHVKQNSLWRRLHCQWVAKLLQSHLSHPNRHWPITRSRRRSFCWFLLDKYGQMMINVSLMYPICIRYKVHYCKVLISSAFEAYYACFKPGPADSKHYKHPECSKCPKLPECSKCPKLTSQSALACRKNI